MAWVLMLLVQEVLLKRELSYYHSISLKTGFIYETDMKDGSANGYHLVDQRYQPMIYSDVIRFMEHGDYIYGYRKDLAGNPFYFICRYGEDCSQTQHLKDSDLRRIIKEKSLSLFTRSAQNNKSSLEYSAYILRDEGSCPEGEWVWHYRDVEESYVPYCGK